MRAKYLLTYFDLAINIFEYPAILFIVAAPNFPTYLLAAITSAGACTSSTKTPTADFGCMKVTSWPAIPYI
jgi:hypothetical protein